MKRTLPLWFSLLGALGCEPATLSSSAEVPTVTAELPPEAATDLPPAMLDPAQPEAAPDGVPAPPEEAPAPTLRARVDQPARGARTFGGTVRVEGVFGGAANPTIDVNGVIVQGGPDGRFTADVPVVDGLNTLVTQVIDGATTLEDRRSILNNADVDPATRVDDAVRVRINRDGFAAISRMVSGVLGGLDFSSLLDGQAPEDFEITELNVGDVDLQLNPIDGAIEAQFSIYNLHIGLRGKVRVLGIPISVRASAGANPAQITARLGIRDDGLGGLDIQMQGADVSLQNFGYNIRNVPGEIEQWFEGQVRRMGEDMIEDALEGIVIPQLFDPNSLNQTLDVFDTQVNLGLGIQDVSVDFGGMTMALDASAAAAARVNQGQAVRSVGPGQPSPQDAHIDLAIAADFVNRLLHAIWAGGALDLSLGGEDGAVDSPIPLTMQILSAALGEAAAGIDPATPVVIGTRALLPPTAHVEANAEHPIVIKAGGLLIDIGTADARLVTVAVDAVIGLALEVDPETGEVVPDMAIEVNADVAETPRGAVKAETLERLIEGLANALPSLLASEMDAEGADPMGAPLPLENTRLTSDAGVLHLLLDLAL